MKEQLRQTTGTVVMIRPDAFGFNPETASSNVFQHVPDASADRVQHAAMDEFEDTVGTLGYHGIRALVIPSRHDVVTPDAVFPNNWFSHHEHGNGHTNGKLVIYPMLAPNRRAERQTQSLEGSLVQVGINDIQVQDFSYLENEGKYLEGTGSIVLDRKRKVAFAMESPRTNKKAFDKWAKETGHEGVFFHAYDKNKLPIYHTNVLMGIGDGFSVICLDAIPNFFERRSVAHKLEQLGKEIIPITVEQMNNFCGNVIELRSHNGEPKVIMSNTAMNSFRSDQLDALSNYADIVPVNIPTIETIGGGSARCMIAEVFPKT